LPARKQYDGTTETDTLVAVVRNITNGGTGNSLGFVYWPTTTTRDKGTVVSNLTADKGEYISTVITPTTAGQTIRFCAFVNNGTETVYGDSLDITTVGLVDLGLSVKWANVNLGAVNEGDPGTYYTFGGTKPYRRIEKHAVYGKDIEVGSRYDAATNDWGASYRLPSQAECQELIDNCNWTETTRNGVNGWLITSKKDGYTDKSIFLPKGGWYDSSPAYIGHYNDVECIWTSTHTGSNQAVDMSNNGFYLYNGIENLGVPIRPVSSSVTLVKTLAPTRVITADVEKDVLNGFALNLPTNAKVGFLFGDSASVRKHTAEMQEVTGSVNGHYSLEKTGLDMGTTYYYCAAYTDGTTTVYGDVDSLTTIGYVDLDLPSGTLWATTNVGAANPLIYGEYYAWGETKSKDYYDESNYAYYKDGNYQTIGYKDVNSDGSSSYCIAGTAYDAATTSFSYASTPTQPQCNELVKNCTWTHVIYNGVGAIKFSSKTHPDRFILLPDAGRYLSGGGYESGYGCYMTATGYSNYQLNDFWTPTNNGGPQAGTGNKNNKYYGMTIRPVLRKNVSIIDNRYVYLTTDSCYEQIGATTATLYGTMKTTNTTDGTYGFVLGDSLNIDATHNTKMVAATNADTNGKYSVDASFGTAKFFRAYVKVGDDYIYGTAKVISAAKVLAVVFNNDESAVINNNAMTVTKKGSPVVTWDDTYHRYVADLSANKIANNPSNYYRVYVGDSKDSFQKSFSLEILMTTTATTSSEADAVSTYERGGFGIGIKNSKLFTGAYFGGYKFEYGSAPTLNQWTHAVMSWDKDKGTLTFYVDGAQVATTKVNGTMGLGSSNYFIVGGNPDGNYDSATTGWSGKIGFANIYDQALSADEVKTLYSNLTK
ncbi:MAG: LamG domain-containing protein, partial [Prevotella sp.]